jgi:hypothetical protein
MKVRQGNRPTAPPPAIAEPQMRAEARVRLRVRRRAGRGSAGRNLAGARELRVGIVGRPIPTVRRTCKQPSDRSSADQENLTDGYVIVIHRNHGLCSEKKRMPLAFENLRTDAMINPQEE